MNLRNISIRTWLIFLTVLLILGVILYFYRARTLPPREEAISFVMDDLQNKFPDADYEILDVKEKSNDGNMYYEIKARVTNYPDSPCPERMHVYYNYPEQGFAVHPPDIITHNCEYCGSGKGQCIILFDEEAIIASHTLPGTEQVDDYIREYDARPGVSYEDGVWQVVWDSPTASYGYVVKISSNNKLLSVERVDKD